MPDTETKALDREILIFMARNAGKGGGGDAFQSLAVRIFEYQFKRNRNYRKFCLLEGKRPEEIRDWRDIPAMPALGFKELVLSTFPIKEAVKIFKTSGTTQEARGAHFLDTLTLYETSLVPGFRRHLIPDGERLAFFFLVSSPEESPNSSLSYMAGMVNRQFAAGKGRYYVRGGEILHDDLRTDLERTEKPALLFATAFSLQYFLDYLKLSRRNLNLPSGSRLMETGGFKGKMKEVSRAALYRECARRLGIEKSHCVGEYGMTELSSQFYDTTLSDKMGKIKRKPFKIGPAWTRTLVIDPKTGREVKKGRVGILRHFDLANRGSVLAVQTEDLGYAAGEGFELVGRRPGSDLRGCSLDYEMFSDS